MDDVRELWDVVWQWLLWAWQWLLALPWQVWGNSVLVWSLDVVFIPIIEWAVGIPTMLSYFFIWLSNPNVYGILGNFSTVVATLWLVANGHEYVFQNRLDRLAQLHENVQKLKRAMLSLQSQDNQENRDKLSDARKKLKNHYFDYSMFLVDDKTERAHLRELIETLDRSLKYFAENVVIGKADNHDSSQMRKRAYVRKAFQQMKLLIQYTEMLIDRRPWYAQLFRWLKDKFLIGVHILWKIVQLFVRALLVVGYVIAWCLQPLWRPFFGVWWLINKVWKIQSTTRKAA